MNINASSILIINPNTSSAITTLVLDKARALYPNIDFSAVSGRFGARYISSRAASVIAAYAALDAYAEHRHNKKAVLLSCFGDPGLFGLREIANVPVVGLAEAACSDAYARYGRFAIVTGGERWVPMLWEFLDLVGLRAHCAGIRCVAKTGGQIAENPAAAHAELLAACEACLDADRADAVILAGAGLVGLAEMLAPSFKKPILCSVEMGIDAVVAASERPFNKPYKGSFAMPAPVETMGIGTELARLFEGRA